MAAEPPEDLQPSNAYLDRVLAAERILGAAQEAVERGMTPPVDLADQMLAAARDTSEIVERMANMGQPVMERTSNAQDKATAARMALVVAGVMGTKRCEHLNKVPIQPAQCLLPMKMTLCLTCTAEPPAIVVPDDACDLCEAQPVTHFRPVTFQLGAIMVIGQICQGCNTRLEGPE